jgi:hypothetical protein
MKQCSLPLLIFSLVSVAAGAQSIPTTPDAGLITSDNQQRVLRGYHIRPTEATRQDEKNEDRALIIDDDFTEVEPTTTQPSPTPSLPPKRIFGVGIGVFVMWLYLLVCGIGCFDLYTGNSGIRHPKLYNKPYNTCICFWFWYVIVFMYMVLAPRDTKTDAVNDGVYATSFYAKYTMMLIMGCAMWYFVITAYIVDYGNEELVFQPVDQDLEKQRNPAQPRSSV